MQSVIHLLPDAIANQIAAGEVVQRPASAVKELLENAVDAGASRIDVWIKQAGKSLIQVTDNGAGMAAQDARMAFERHATSKIREQKDLFDIRTLGFRGEALASIAAVAQVKLRTRLQGQEIGTEIDIEGSEVKKQQPCAGPPGSTFMVKNLFFNVPARRNFLKSNPVETRHIMNEFVRVALAHPEVHFSLRHNDTEVYELSAGELEGRIYGLLGEDLRGKLASVQEATGYVAIRGFVGKPEAYRKSRGEQYFFVNDRYIRSPYLHHALATAYEGFLPKDTHPFYCLFLDIDPVHVDINIHPTKTEVKFDDERTLYALLQGVVKQVLGRMHQTPEGDLPQEALHRQIYQSGGGSAGSSSGGGSRRPPDLPAQSQPRQEDWDALYRPIGKPGGASQSPERQGALFPETAKPASRPERPVAREEEESSLLAPFGQGYLLTARGGQLYIIHQHLAHQRVLFERFMAAQQGKPLASQQLLFPQTVEFSPADFATLQEVLDLLHKMGFEVKEFGRNTFIVHGTPAGIPTGKVRHLFEQIVEDLKAAGSSRAPEQLFGRMAQALAARGAVTSQQKLSMLEVKQIVADLFRCEVPGTAPNGRPTFRVLSSDELSRFFEG